MKKIKIGSFFIGSKESLTIVSGPCVIESEEHALRSAEKLKEIFGQAEVNLIYKSSYDKANRSSIQSYRGPGLEKGLKILERVKREFNLPVFTDIHSPDQAKPVSEVCDIIQIPAFLCRQTDLLIAAGKTKCTINIKKGQFMAPWDMKNVVEKILTTGNDNLILTDRGTSFGYNNLVSDMRSIPIMQKFGFPVCFDATHSVQLPGGLGHASSGQREFIPTLAKASIAAGANLLYMESHPCPTDAKCDSETVFPFDDLPQFLHEVKSLYEVCSQNLPSSV